MNNLTFMEPDPYRVSHTFSQHHWHPHFTDKETEPWVGKITCIARSWLKGGVQARCPDSKAGEPGLER